MAELPKAPVKRILKRYGAKRVSKKAIKSFRELIENKAKEITKGACEVAERDGTKTVFQKDIFEVK